MATAAYLDKLPHDIELLNFTGTREYISIATPMDGEFNANGEQLYSIYCDSRDRWWKVQVEKYIRDHQEALYPP